MKFIIALTALAAAATAAPTNDPSPRNWFSDAVDDVKDGVKDGVHDVENGAKTVEQIAAKLCPTIKQCVVALAPSVIACGAAAASEAVNVWADASCIAAAINADVNPVSRDHTLWCWISINVYSLQLARNAFKTGNVEGGRVAARSNHDVNDLYIHIHFLYILDMYKHYSYDECKTNFFTFSLSRSTDSSTCF